MFIETREPPPLFSTTEVRIALPEGHEIKLKAKVVHILSEETSKAEGKRPGVGVELFELDPLMKKQIWHLVEYAKWEAGSPGARSYATALMEFAQAFSSSADSEKWSSLPPEVRNEDKPPATADSLPAEEPVGRVSEKPVITSIPAVAPLYSGVQEILKTRSEIDLESVPTDRPDSESAPAAARKSSDSRGPGKLPSAGPGQSSRAAVGAADDIQKQIDQAIKDVACKRYRMAIRTLESLMIARPERTECRKWLITARARLAVRNKNRPEAVGCYQALLEIDKENREALKYVSSFQTEETANKVPFARYFRKKT